jgi:tRNA acetyltransferase TAN1
VVFARFNDKSVDPVKIVHELCLEAQANKDIKKSRYIKRLTPISMMKKTLSVDLEAFAKEVLKPHFHSGGPPKKVNYNPHSPTDSHDLAHLVPDTN